MGASSHSRPRLANQRNSVLFSYAFGLRPWADHVADTHLGRRSHKPLEVWPCVGIEFDFADIGLVSLLQWGVPSEIPSGWDSPRFHTCRSQSDPTDFFVPADERGDCTGRTCSMRRGDLSSGWCLKCGPFPRLQYARSAERGKSDLGHMRTFKLRHHPSSATRHSSTTGFQKLIFARDTTLTAFSPRWPLALT